ncbi:b188dcbe-fc4d-4a37-b76a-460ffdd78658 [Thermothielavioides terrestris]|uniref:Uncharacterized protein n=2 Tax=Thermothielavioides terrestris TaxID=2587410 RepID=G2R4G2_THETT|nr:uncharacterized protein THITE_2088386 [Thermothielavioides terrestris NRRL 8126]AEO66906.1 hypothetical protein THITE_2088386 [Thermothielavioides terrestris NRRL 8126]SPQ23606.1 b188dcbe-fc4d-4a37-b76a-460ffdd78658 [Thermothielavioides terrestris]
MPWLSIIGIGGSRFAFSTDNATVLKGYEEIHSGIHSPRLALTPLGNVRQFIRAITALPEAVCLQMAWDVAAGLE